MGELLNVAVDDFIESQKGLKCDIKKFNDDKGHFPDDALDNSIGLACTDMMARTLGVKYEDGEKKGGKCFTNAVIKKIKGRMIDYFKPEYNYYINEKSFNAWHNETCNCVLDVLKKHYYTRDYKNKDNQEKPVRYGKAQKIVNMTFKYLLCFAYEGGYYNQYKERFENCHIPLDSYILKALFYKPKPESISEKINGEYKGEGKLIEEESKDFEKYFSVDGSGYIKEKDKDNHVIRNYGTWSNIEPKEYESIQKAVKKRIPSEFSSKPLIWENKVWTLAAEFLNNKTFIDYDK